MLIPFLYGTYDLEKLMFRPYSKNYFFSKSINYNYSAPADFKKVTTYLSSIFTDEELFRFAVYVLSTFLSKNKISEKFIWWMGGGAKKVIDF